MLKLYDTDDNWMYIHIPKTSGTNFKFTVRNSYNRNYYQYVYNNDYKLTDSIISLLWNDADLLKDAGKSELLLFVVNFFSQIMKKELDHTTQHAPLWVWQKLNIYNSEKVMTIVRNPYTRFISHYYSHLYWLKKYFVFDNILPHEFIHHKNINLLLSMEHCNYLTRQIDYIKNIDGKVQCNEFYKMETDLEKLEKKFNLIDINKHKYNERIYDKKISYKNFYTQDLIKFVQDHYEKDFEYFGYNQNPFWFE